MSAEALVHPEPQEPQARMTKEQMLSEIEAIFGDVSEVREAFQKGSMDGDMMKKLFASIMETNEYLMTNMDTKTKIGKLPMAWGETSITWRGVNYKAKDTEGKERVILHECSGHVPAGSLVAIMGPSGCGKSTLLDILAQKKTTPFEGKVYCNGHDVTGDKFFRRYSTYVPQEDNMHEVLTVKEVIMFDLALKNPPWKNIQADPALREKMPDVFLSILGLSEVKNTIIGGSKSGLRGVSGGQKRRVTLARGAVTGAQLLFADEPTSGLSATDAETCTKMLRFLCKRVGITCIVVIHQPRVEVAELFDHLILLTSGPSKWGGSVVYNGPMDGAIAYCDKVGYPVPLRANPTDWLMDVISPGYKHGLVKAGEKEPDQSVQEFVSYYKNHEAPAVELAVNTAVAIVGTHPKTLAVNKFSRLSEVLTEEAKSNRPARREESVYGSSFLRQVMVLTSVKMKLLKRDKKGLKMRVGMALMQALIVGIAYWNIASKQEILHVQFIFMCMQLSAIAGMNVMPGLVDLRIVMKKDVDEGLHSVTAWIVSNASLDILINLFTSTLFIIVLFSMSHLDWNIFTSFFFWVMLCQFVMDAYFNLIGAIAPTGQLSQQIAMPLMIMFILFNGFLVSRESTPDFMVWALYVSPFYYGITRLAVDAYGPDACGTVGCAQVMSAYGFLDGPSEELAITVLVSLFVVFRIGQVFCLGLLNNAQR